MTRSQQVEKQEQRLDKTTWRRHLRRPLGNPSVSVRWLLSLAPSLAMKQTRAARRKCPGQGHPRGASPRERESVRAGICLGCPELVRLTNPPSSRAKPKLCCEVSRSSGPLLLLLLLLPCLSDMKEQKQSKFVSEGALIFPCSSFSH